MNRTAYSYDPTQVGHGSRGHPEQPARLESVHAALTASALTDSLLRIDVAEAATGQLQRAHDPEYLARLSAIRPRGLHMLDADTYMTDESLAIAVRAAGSGIACVDAVLNGAADNAFALTRPPGHHAPAGRAMGFCLINNIAVAARHAENQYGVDRIAIVDFDVHHGNGTQDIFYQDGRVLFMSMHQYPLFPGTGSVKELGAGPGLGTTLNVPLPAGCSDTAYGLVFDRIFEEKLRAFRPDILLVSAGYDAHWRDPLANMRVSTTGFSDLVARLVQWAEAFCHGRLVLFLEGGYDLSALSHSVVATFRRLQDPHAAIDDPLGPSPTGERAIDGYLEEVIALLQ